MLYAAKKREKKPGGCNIPNEVIRDKSNAEPKTWGKKVRIRETREIRGRGIREGGKEKEEPERTQRVGGEMGIPGAG